MLAPAGLAALLGTGIWLGPFRSVEPRLNRVPLVRQATSYTCGAAVLESILAYYGEEWSEDTLARELKADPDQGTDHREIARFARENGLTVEIREHMTVEDLREAVNGGHPVVVAIQAWGERPEGYAVGWEDGHYSIVVGLDEEKVYLMDPSTTGNYAYIAIPEFLARWHDYYLDNDGRRVEVVHLGMVFSSPRPPAFNPSELKPLE